MDTHEVPDPIAFQKMWKDKAEAVIAFEDAKRRYLEAKEAIRFEVKCEMTLKAEELLSQPKYGKEAEDFWFELEKLI